VGVKLAAVLRGEHCAAARDDVGDRWHVQLVGTNDVPGARRFV
jgi:hypothetical protein